MKGKRTKEREPKQQARKKRPLAAIADLRLLLIVAAVVLAAMGIFAWAFRQIHIGYVEEDGYVVATSEVYTRLNGGAEEGSGIALTAVKSNDEIFSRGGNYYIGQDMTEYESVYPLYANGGLALYFINDTAQLVTDEFELLSTYAGMYVAGGLSFNSDKSQADIETIYLVKLKNGLYENALSITLTKTGYESVMGVNSLVNFGSDSIRWYEITDGKLVYHEIEDVDGLTLEIGGETFSYADFLEKLNGAAADTVSSSGSAGADEDEPEEEESETEEATVETQDAGSAERQEGADTEGSDDENEKIKKESEGVASTGSYGTGSSGSASGSGSADGSGSGSGSGSGGSDGSGSFFLLLGISWCSSICY